MAALNHGHDSRNGFRRVVALFGAQSRVDGKRFYSGGRDFHNNLSYLFEVRFSRRDNFAKQHCANRWLGGRRIKVTKFDAPKATLMSYIIKGILSRKLPWALVLLGVMIAIVLEMSGIPSLAFAVGVYLPLASSSPIFIGGMIRLLVDRYLRVKFRHKNLSDVELIAEGDKSRGVLLASGYIAGGAITGIVIAAKELVAPLAVIGHRIDEWQTAHNPFFNGPNSDLLALIPFLVLCVLLYLVGRDVVLKARPSGGTA